MGLYITTFAVVLFFAIWLTAEYNGRIARRQSMKFSKMIAEQEKELAHLRSFVSNGQATEKQASTQLVMAEKRGREVERQYNKLMSKYKRLNEAFLKLVENLGDDDFKGSQVARMVLDEIKKAQPALDNSDKTGEAEAKKAFGRIKEKLSGDSAA